MKPYHNTTIPLEAQYLYRRALEMIDQQKEDIALVYLRQAVFIAPGFSKAYRELGNCLARLGRLEEASVYHVKASRIDPIHCGAAADGITMKTQDEIQTVPGHFPTCLVW
ncbi:MAG: tetratricopeptide repeat protein [Methanoregula sp.]|jgi:tetratricopeptide (TPR) repeat protein